MCHSLVPDGRWHLIACIRPDGMRLRTDNHQPTIIAIEASLDTIRRWRHTCHTHFFEGGCQLCAAREEILLTQRPNLTWRLRLWRSIVTDSYVTRRGSACHIHCWHVMIQTCRGIDRLRSVSPGDTTVS